MTTIRLGYDPNMCARSAVHCRGPAAGGRVHRHPLRAAAASDSVASGEIDFNLESAAWLVSHLDAGDPITALAGLHVGCYELFAHEPIRTISDLRGESVGIQRLGSNSHLLLSIMAAHVGLIPHTDINWIRTDFNFKELFAEGKVDAFLGAPPKSQELRAARSAA